MKPGIYEMPDTQYHADPCPVPSLSAGCAETLLFKSAAHAFTEHPRLDANKRFTFNAATDAGSIAHALLFEGIDKMAVIDADDWRTKVAKEARDAARAEGKIPLLTKQVEPIKAMVASARRAWARNDDLLGYAPEDGVGERSCFWKEGDTWLRMRPDWLSNDRRIIIDGKFTATSAHPSAFARQILAMAYDLRAAFYCRGVKALWETECKYLFLVVESEPPYEAVIIGVGPTYVSLGNDKAQLAIDTWAECMRTCKWPGYGNKIFYADAPAYALTQWEERAELLGAQA